MKKTLLIICCIQGIIANVNAQDILTKKNGEDITVKVEEVNSTEIKYRKFDNLNGPVYTISKTEVFSIKYQNGQKDVFAEKVKETQKTPESTKKNEVANLNETSIGLGAGQDYGGFGGNLTFFPQKNIGLFVGGGYALVGLGYNVGAKIRLIGDKDKSSFSPYLLGMYGYNAGIVITNATQYNKLFYGVSAGIGFDYWSNPKNTGYWSFAIILPNRSDEVTSYINSLKKFGVVYTNELLPIAFSIGYKFIISN